MANAVDANRSWIAKAIAKLAEDRRREVDTPLLTVTVPDAASIAGARWLESRLQRRFGPSTGTNIAGALALAAEMQSQGQSGSIATPACDAGDRYADTIYENSWVASRKIDLRDWQRRFQDLSGARPFGHDLPRVDRNGK